MTVAVSVLGYMGFSSMFARFSRHGLMEENKVNVAIKIPFLQCLCLDSFQMVCAFLDHTSLLACSVVNSEINAVLSTNNTVLWQQFTLERWATLFLVVSGTEALHRKKTAATGPKNEQKDTDSQVDSAQRNDSNAAQVKLHYADLTEFCGVPWKIVYIFLSSVFEKYQRAHWYSRHWYRR